MSTRYIAAHIPTELVYSTVQPSNIAQSTEHDPSTTEQNQYFTSVFRISFQLNPDPAKNLNPDPEDHESGSGSKLFLNTTYLRKNNLLIIRFSHKKKSIKR